jgi:hypothetical protein
MKDRKPMVDVSSSQPFELKMEDIRKARKSMTNTSAHVVTGDIVTSDAPVSKDDKRTLKQD